MSEITIRRIHGVFTPSINNRPQPLANITTTVKTFNLGASNLKRSIRIFVPANTSPDIITVLFDTSNSAALQNISANVQTANAGMVLQSNGFTTIDIGVQQWMALITSGNTYQCQYEFCTDLMGRGMSNAT